MIEVHVLSALSDNYIYVLFETLSKKVAVIDPSESEPVIDFLAKKKWSLDLILNTHHHHDHVGGNFDLKNRFSCEVHCSNYDFSRIPGATHALKHNDSLSFGHSHFQILEVPGHTLGAIAYYSSFNKLLFTGDTLFPFGCGRLFEGTPQQLFQSLKLLSDLPGETQVYAGHEYGLQNSGFALEQNMQSTEIKEIFVKLRSQTSGQRRSVPTSINQENRLNPFVRAENLDKFTQLRKLKDDFRLENTDSLG